jgi:hypothetical protein
MQTTKLLKSNHHLNRYSSISAVHRILSNARAVAYVTGSSLDSPDLTTSICLHYRSSSAAGPPGEEARDSAKQGMQMELSDTLKSAHKTVVEADLPQELRETAFAEVLRHMLRAPSRPSPESRDHVDSPSPNGETSGLDRLGARVGVDTSALADLFEIQGDSVSLHVTSSRIPQAKSAATREVALLIAAARQGSGADDAWTSVGHIRDALQDYKKYDTNNFSAYLRRVADAFNFRGKGSSMEIRLTQPGWEIATALIASLAGGAT